MPSAPASTPPPRPRSTRFAGIPNADGQKYELERDNLENARRQAALHGLPAAPIRLFSGKLFTSSNAAAETVPLASGISGEAALGRPRAVTTSTRARPSDYDDEE